MDYSDAHWSELHFKGMTSTYHITTNTSPLELRVNHTIQSESLLRNDLTATLFVDSPCYGKLIHAWEPTGETF